MQAELAEDVTAPEHVAAAEHVTAAEHVAAAGTGFQPVDVSGALPPRQFDEAGTLRQPEKQEYYQVFEIFYIS